MHKMTIGNGSQVRRVLTKRRDSITCRGDGHQSMCVTVYITRTHTSRWVVEPSATHRLPLLLVFIAWVSIVAGAAAILLLAGLSNSFSIKSPGDFPLLLFIYFFFFSFSFSFSFSPASIYPPASMGKVVVASLMETQRNPMKCTEMETFIRPNWIGGKLLGYIQIIPSQYKPNPTPNPLPSLFLCRTVKLVLWFMLTIGKKNVINWLSQMDGGGWDYARAGVFRQRDGRNGLDG